MLRAYEIQSAKWAAPSKRWALLFTVVLATTGCQPKGSTAPQSQAAAAQAPVLQNGWESSGGDGVACFNDVKTAEAATEELKSTGFMTPATRLKIKSVQTLETWDYVSGTGAQEMTGLGDYLKATALVMDNSLKALTSRVQIEKIVLENLSRFTPLFTLQIELAKAHAPLEQWYASTQVKQVDDSQPARPLTDKCVLIQLANRATRSSHGTVPETVIIYDKELFDGKLGPADQALLVLHEYLYLIGREGGHENSDAIRKFNAFLFSQSAQAWPSYDLLSMRLVVGHPYGDYMRFFTEAPELKDQVAAPGTNYSRYLALISLMKKLRVEMATCLQEKNYATATDKDRIQRACQQQTIENASPLTNLLSAEEAFLFIARFHLDTIDAKLNSELLSTWDLDYPTNAKAVDKERAESVCRTMEKQPAKYWLPLQDKAFTYCRETMKLNIKALADRGRDTYFSCFSPKQTIIWHEHQDANQGLVFALNVNPQTGAITDGDFAGKAELLTTVEGKVEQDYGYGNRQYSAERIYRLTPNGDGDQRRLLGYLSVEPETVTKVEYTDQSKSAVKFMEIRLSDCSITETNLGENLFYYQ